MNQIAALSKSLLRGQMVSIKNGVPYFGITNIPREIGRSIERKFGVTVNKTRMQSKTRYGDPVTYMEYRLFYTENNKAGIERMKAYISEIESKPYDKKNPKGPKVKSVKPTAAVVGNLFP